MVGGGQRSSLPKEVKGGGGGKSKGGGSSHGGGRHSGKGGGGVSEVDQPKSGGGGSVDAANGRQGKENGGSMDLEMVKTHVVYTKSLGRRSEAGRAAVAVQTGSFNEEGASRHLGFEDRSKPKDTPWNVHSLLARFSSHGQTGGGVSSSSAMELEPVDSAQQKGSLDELAKVWSNAAFVHDGSMVVEEGKVD